MTPRSTHSGSSLSKPSAIQRLLQLPGAEMAVEVCPLGILDLQERLHEAIPKQSRQLFVLLQCAKCIQHVGWKPLNVCNFWGIVRDLVHVLAGVHKCRIRLQLLLKAPEPRRQQTCLQKIWICSSICKTDFKAVIFGHSDCMSAVVTTERDPIWSPRCTRSCHLAINALEGVDGWIGDRAHGAYLLKHTS